MLNLIYPSLCHYHWFPVNRKDQSFEHEIYLTL